MTPRRAQARAPAAKELYDWLAPRAASLESPHSPVPSATRFALDRRSTRYAEDGSIESTTIRGTSAARVALGRKNYLFRQAPMRR